MTDVDFQRVQTIQPHQLRAKAILARHPEVRQLFGNTPSTALWVFALVAAMIAMAWGVRDSSWWLVFAVAYGVGAFIDHSLYVLIHEATHNLIFRSSNANRVMGIIANLPMLFPAAIGFRNYHLLHHSHLGEYGWDADLSTDWEARWVGRSPLRKALWFLFFFVVEGVIRPARLARISGIKLIEPWVIVNLVVQLAFIAGVIVLMGWKALGFLAIASVFSVGLHPVGARWVQEHYLFRPGQETYSYYGPLNRITFNMGYHNEHHDLVKVPWSRLPRLRKMAPEFYEPLHAHSSWTGLLIRFIFDRDITLFSRAVRPDRGGSLARPEVETMSGPITGDVHAQPV